MHADVYDAFAEKFAAAMAALKVGDPLDEATEVGPVATESGRDELAELVDDARAKGATILTGGAAPDGPGWFYPPTVVADVTADMRLAPGGGVRPGRHAVQGRRRATRRSRSPTRPPSVSSSAVWTNDADEQELFSTRARGGRACSSTA